MPGIHIFWPEYVAAPRSFVIKRMCKREFEVCSDICYCVTSLLSRFAATVRRDCSPMLARLFSMMITNQAMPIMLCIINAKLLYVVHYSWILVTSHPRPCPMPAPGWSDAFFDGYAPNSDAHRRNSKVAQRSLIVRKANGGVCLVQATMLTILGLRCSW